MIGFVYEADQDAIKEAQDRVDELRHQEMLDKIDEAIDALEDSKAENNVYDYTGTQVLNDYNDNTASSVYDMFQNAVDPSVFANEVYTKTGSVGVPKDVLNQPLSFQIGDIRLDGVQDVESLADAIIQQLPNALFQKMYQK